MSSSENISGRTLGQAAGDAPRGRRQIRIPSEEFRKTSVDEFFFDDEEFPKSPEGNEIITTDTINELLENMSSGKIFIEFAFDISLNANLINLSPDKLIRFFLFKMKMMKLIRTGTTS